MLLVYFSANSEYTHRFVAKLRHPAVRLPTLTKEPTLRVDEPFVLVTPTYGPVAIAGPFPNKSSNSSMSKTTDAI